MKSPTTVFLNNTKTNIVITTIRQQFLGRVEVKAALPPEVFHTPAWPTNPQPEIKVPLVQEIELGSKVPFKQDISYQLIPSIISAVTFKQYTGYQLIPKNKENTGYQTVYRLPTNTTRSFDLLFHPR